MNKLKNEENNILDLAHVLTSSGEAFAYATVIRTAGATSAKPGAKAIISSDGQILKGWVGGGCIRTSVATATITAIRTGAPQLISVMPQDVIDKIGISVGDQYEGKKFLKMVVHQRARLIFSSNLIRRRPNLLSMAKRQSLKR